MDKRCEEEFDYEEEFHLGRFNEVGRERSKIIRHMKDNPHKEESEW